MHSYVYTVVHLITACLATVTLYVLSIEHLRRLYYSHHTEDRYRHSRASSTHSQSAKGSVIQKQSTFVSSNSPWKKKNKNKKKTHIINGISWLDLSSDEIKRKQLVSQVFTALFIICSLFRSTIRVYLELSSFHLTPSAAHCPTVMRLIAVLYALVKSSLYMVMVSRIDMSFSRSIFAYKQRTIVSLYSIIVAGLMIFLFWFPFAMQSETEHNSYTRNGQNVKSSSDESNNQRRVRNCSAKASTAFSIFNVMFDVILMITTIVMFVRPLRGLFDDDNEPQNCDAHDHHSGHHHLSHSDLKKLQMKLLPLKYTVLSLTAVIANFLAILILILGYGIGFTIENPISVAMLLLMSQLWSQEYWLLFGPLLKSLKILRLVNEDTQHTITLMTHHFSMMKTKQTIQRLSVSHRVMMGRPSKIISLDLNEQC